MAPYSAPVCAATVGRNVMPAWLTTRLMPTVATISRLSGCRVNLSA
jgi:hypothetical protein